MASIRDLQHTLEQIDGKSYKAYKDIAGNYTDGTGTLYIDHVQGDPFGTPSRLRYTIPWEASGFPGAFVSTARRRIAFRDYLSRVFASEAKQVSRSRGSGSSGRIEMTTPGAEILERSSIILTDGGIEARFKAGLPAQGRRILGHQARHMLCTDIPRIATQALTTAGINEETCFTHLTVHEDADAMRDQLADRGLVAFIANGAILPRKSGISEEPLASSDAVPFDTPDNRQMTLERPNHGTITGMGIPRGVTLIVGGGYHGKSTLLSAIERGVYNHIPGDGREWVVAHADTLKVRAEDGRSITGVSISPFIQNLPYGKSTDHFMSENASGSTSQAANIMEGLEAGASVIAMDEDTSATNFMIRDQRMQELISKDKEPITPYIDKVRQLYSDHGVSTVLVLGGSGDYLDRADTVIAMDTFRPYDVTQKAHEIADTYATHRRQEGGNSFGDITPRSISVDLRHAAKGPKGVKIKVPHRHLIQLGTTTIDLTAVAQTVDKSQTNAIATAIMHLFQKDDQPSHLAERISHIQYMIEKNGIDAISPHPTDELAAFRPHELAAAINRLRILQVNS